MPLSSNGQHVRVIKADTATAYLVSRPWLELAVSRIAGYETQENAVARLRHEASLARLRQTVQDSLRSELRSKIIRLESVVELQEQQKQEYEHSLGLLERHRRRNRLWRPLAVTTSAGLVALIILR
jgi:hypothetical protein